MKVKALMDFKMYAENKHVKKGDVLNITKKRFEELEKGANKWGYEHFVEEVKETKKVKETKEVKETPKKATKKNTKKSEPKK